MSNQEEYIYNSDYYTDNYALLAGSLVSLTEDGNKSIILLCIKPLNIKCLADCLTRKTDKLISSITYDEDHCTGDISFGDNMIFINPIPRFCDPSSYMDLAITITSLKGSLDSDMKELMNLAYARILKRKGDITRYSKKEISRMMDMEVLSIVTGVAQEKEDTIANIGDTDYSLHPEGVSPWHNVLLD